jgi:hypothetical protein
MQLMADKLHQALSPAGTRMMLWVFFAAAATLPNAQKPDCFRKE